MLIQFRIGTVVRPLIRVTVCFWAVMVMVSGNLWSQDGSEVPVGSEAGVIEREAMEEAEEKVLATKMPEEVEVEEQRISEEMEEEVTFYVQNIRLEGEQLIPLEHFEPLLSRYEEREMTLRDLEILKKLIAREYRGQGYFARVYLPPQRVEGGEVVLHVVFSRMGRMDVEGQRYFRESKIRSYWEIPEGEFVTYDKIRDGILDMNRNPDRKVKPILRAGEAPGTIDVTLKVEDHFPMHLGYSFDNRGVKLTGKRRTGLTFRHNNLLSMDDIFLIGTVFGNRFGAIFLQHLIPLTTFGTRLTTGFSHAQVNPKKEFERFGINGISQTYTVRVRQRLFRTENYGGEAYIGYDIKNKRTRILSVTSVWDKLRILSFGGSMQGRDKTGVWSISQDLDFGLPINGDGFPLNSRGAEVSFFKYGFSIQRHQRLPYGTKGILKFHGQVSKDRLMPQEQLFFGGAATVRGYPESDYLADQGMITNLEYWVPMFDTSERRGMMNRALHAMGVTNDAPTFLKDIKIHILGFFDHGYGRNKDSSGQDERVTRNLMSVGGGFEIRFRKYVSFRAEWGVPLHDDPITETGAEQFHFRVAFDV